MHLLLKYGLPFTTVTISHGNSTVDIPDILVDTGSGSTIMSADVLASIGIAPLPEDTLSTIRGVGGSEVVFSRQVDSLRIGPCSIAAFAVEIGGMDYGFKIKGILRMDLLTRVGAIINLQDMEIEFTGNAVND